MTYARVIPRDLFNEAKLLKCLGRLALLHHEGWTPKGFVIENDGSPFAIDLNDNGLTVVSGLSVYVTDGSNVFDLDLYSIYNYKDHYPLSVYDMERGHIEVFNEDGDLRTEFYEYVAEVLVDFLVT